MSPKKPSYFSQRRTNGEKIYDWYSEPAAFWVHFLALMKDTSSEVGMLAHPLGKLPCQDSKGIYDQWIGYLLPTIKLLNSTHKRNHALEPTQKKRGPTGTDISKEEVKRDEDKVICTGTPCQPWVPSIPSYWTPCLLNKNESWVRHKKFHGLYQLKEQKKKHKNIHRGSSVSSLGCHIQIFPGTPVVTLDYTLLKFLQ